MRVTVLAYFFPPVNQVGYKRPLRLVDYLRKEGHDVTVYAVSPSTPQLWNFTGVDPDLVKLIPPGVKVVRTPSIHPIKGLLGLRDRLKGKNSPGVHGTRVEIKSAAAAAPGAATTDGPAKTAPAAPAAAATVPPALREPAPKGRAQSLIDTIQGWFEVPDPYWGWILTTLPGLLLRTLLFRPKAIYVTAPPWSPLLAAVIAGKLLRIPVHADFRDPWTINKYWKAKKVSRVLEGWVMRNCASVIANTESMGKAFRESYPELGSRLSVVYNGYEADTAAAMGALREKVAPAKRRDLFTVTHIGMLYPNRMPRSLAATLAEAAAAWKGPRPLRLRFVGNVMDPAPLLEEFGRRGVIDVLEFTGEVKTSKAREEQVLADVLLLLQSGTMEQIPAKVFEYAFAGNPVLCVADKGSETADLVERYALGEVMHGGEEASAWLARFEALCRSGDGGWAIPEKFLQEFDGPRLSERMFREMLAKGC
jgi:glycosyltransferase involved in cell wall biosynthesis